MNKIFFILMIVNSFAHADSISLECEKKILAYRAAIKGSTKNNLRTYQMKIEENIADPDTKTSIVVGNYLLKAVDNIQNKKELTKKENEILARICKLKTFNVEAVGEVIESIEGESFKTASPHTPGKAS